MRGNKFAKRVMLVYTGGSEAAKAGYLKDTRTQDDFFKTGFYDLPDIPKYAFTEKADDKVKYDLFNLLDFGKTPPSITDFTKELHAAAYLAMIQNMWKSEYPVISGDTAILATLYNIGESGGVTGINDSPKSNAFGDFAKANYPYMQYLLGIE